MARVCVENDCKKPPVDHVWIVIHNRNIGMVTSGYSQRLEFSTMSNYYLHCCHVGHEEAECIVLRNKPRQSGSSKPQPKGNAKSSIAPPTGSEDVEKVAGFEGGNGRILEKEENQRREEPAK